MTRHNMDHVSNVKAGVTQQQRISSFFFHQLGHLYTHFDIISTFFEVTIYKLNMSTFFAYVTRMKIFVKF